MPESKAFCIDLGFIVDLVWCLEPFLSSLVFCFSLVSLYLFLYLFIFLKVWDKFTNNLYLEEHFT